MALKVTKVDVWAGDLRDTPGGLADVLEQVAASGGSVEFIIARRNDKQPGWGCPASVGFALAPRRSRRPISTDVSMHPLPSPSARDEEDGFSYEA